jgi:EF hand
MTRTLLQLVAVSLFGVVCALPVKSDEPSNSLGDDWIRVQLRSVRPEQNVDRLLEMLNRNFTESDVNGGGVSAKDYEISEALYNANQRANRLGQTIRSDLDGDGIVTRAEVKTVMTKRANQPIRTNGMHVEPTSEQVAAILDRLVSDVFQADANNDGQLTLQEMLAEPKDRKRQYPWHGARQMVPMSLDADKDGIVSRKEYDSAVKRIIGEIDRDASGEVSPDEAAAFATAAQESWQSIKAQERSVRP